MSETFGNRLKRFALTVDIVDEDIFRQAWDLVRLYISGQLNPSYWALLAEGEVNHKPGLLARDCSIGNKPSFSLKTDDDRYNGLAAYSFGEGKPLWVVSPDKQPLGPDTSQQDDWSQAGNLPPYSRSTDADIRTAILVPLRWKGRMLGVLDLQSSQYPERTKRVTTELGLLADTLSILLTLLDLNQARRASTLEAINLHRSALQQETWPALTKPQIFVASAKRADEAVMGTIRSTLDGFSEQLQVHYWKDSSNSGNINWDTLKQVQASQLGLCYFSEPVDDPKNGFKYQDNGNVIFEAGMFQSLTNPTPTEHPINWIPIREAHRLCPPPPFDFAQERMIIVERIGEKNSANLDKLRGELKARIENLLG